MQKADQLRHERQVELSDYTAGRTAQGVTQGFAHIMRQFTGWLRASLSSRP